MTADSEISQRFFLVGVPRSGTSLLQALLASHTQITSFTESHFFSRPYAFLPLMGAVLRRDPAQQVFGFLNENQLSLGAAAQWFEPPAPFFLRFSASRTLASSMVARRLIDVLDEAAQERASPCWLEKTPRHLHAIALIQKACGARAKPQFIHLIRGGLPTVTSLYRASPQWQSPLSLEACAGRWNQDLALSLRYAGKPNHHVIRYEDLTEDPERVLRQLLHALQLNWSPEILNRYGQTARALRASGEHWKQGTERPITPADTSQEVLDACQRQRVEAQLQQPLYDALSRHAIGASRRA